MGSFLESINAFVARGFWPAVLVTFIAGLIPFVLWLLLRKVNKYLATIIQCILWVTIYIYIFIIRRGAGGSGVIWIIFAAMSFIGMIITIVTTKNAAKITTTESAQAPSP